jgi:formylglycine-generating enzyme required for sulfatase activity
MKLCPVCETTYPNHHTICSRERCGAVLIVTRELEPGFRIRGKYEIVRTLGRGGFGTVYLAEDILRRGRLRALKFINAEVSDDPKRLNRFRQEAEIELRHPNVVEVLDLEQAEDGSLYIAMEYVDGPELRVALGVGSWSVERALEIARGIALGLGAAHARGIIHRDVKPENILLAGAHGPMETPKLLDFGIAAMKESSAAVSRTRGMVLSMQYAAPEQWNLMPSEQLDGRADLYALGGVLHEMLTGQTIFHSHNTGGWMHQHLQGVRQAPSRLRPELAEWPGLDAMVLRLLAVDREERPRDVAEFLEELAAVRQKRVFQRVADQKTADRRTVRMGGGRSDTVLESSRAGDSKQAGARGIGRWLIAGGIGLVVLAVAGAIYLGMSGTEIHWTGTRGAVHADTNAAGAVRENSRDGQKYVWIPAGNFEMGCSAGDSECGEDEKPAHPVSILKGFWMGQTPVTVGAWKRYRAATNAPALLTYDGVSKRSWNEGSSDDMPVVSESWEQAMSFCQWAGMKLPSEAEWEYGARAGTQGRRYGDLDSIAWYGNNSGNKPIDAAALWNSVGQDAATYEQRVMANGNFIHQAGQKQPNAWQLYDMLGDVFEWTADWYGANYYQSAADQDPPGPQSGQKRVIRGGSWANIAGKVRVSVRSSTEPDSHFTGIGFRCSGEF